MLTIRKSDERGHAEHGWLDSRHTFTFADYHDAAHMGFRALRVINEDSVAAAQGFGTHSHRDMEILTYVLEGSLEHKDSLGNGSILRPGDVQRMSAGTGVLHSELNPSPTERVHFLQIWVLPERRGISPSYAEKHFPQAERRGRLRLFASRDGREGSLSWNQDADLYGALLAKGERVTHELRPGRHAWIQIARGAIELDGHRLSAGDGAAISEQRTLELKGTADAELLLFDLS